MKHKGFTVLEILVAISILALAVTIVAFSFSKLNSSQALDKSATLVTSILDEARSLTLSSKGATYSQPDPANVVTSLHALVGMRNITLSGGGTSVVFKRLTGNTDETGTAEIFLKASPTTFRTITVRATGIVELD